MPPAPGRQRRRKAAHDGREKVQDFGLGVPLEELEGGGNAPSAP